MMAPVAYWFTVFVCRAENMRLSTFFGQVIRVEIMAVKSYAVLFLPCAYTGTRLLLHRAETQTKGRLRCR